MKTNGTTRKARVRCATVFASSLRNLSDTHWINIIAKVQKHLLKEKNNTVSQSRDRSGTGSSTLVDNEDEELDLDGDFIMDVE